MQHALNIHEFPAEYAGRKTYVRVAGQSKLVACCYVYTGNDGKYHLHPNYGGNYDAVSATSDNIRAPMLMKSMGAYKSPVDGSFITDRSQHREHLKQHNLVEVGNEPVGNMSRPEPIKPNREVGERIKHHLDSIKAMPQKQYNEQVQAAKVQVNAT